MNNLIRPLILGCVPVAIASLLAAGCQKSSAPSVQPTIDSSIHLQSHSATPNSTPPAIVIAAPSAAPKSEDTITKHEAQVAGTSKGDLTDIPQSPVSAKATAKPKIKAEDAYQQEKPTLMGLKLGSNKNVVLDRFGKAKKQFIMDEDTDPIQVYDFIDFSVGFNKKDTLEFVDVHTAEIDPGLRGLHLGQKVQDAIAILGKPDTNTTYVLSYKSQGTLLKLDIDPKENTIQSIKLFADR
ncbi:hypothetical protein SAMN04487897_111112 [Paenibacillus sp. yr247]|uniref:hypothetical protein n=1 Tax=Paenibacillus sp. yr247 TaxID=1761880 RepID=UPI000883C364|nr:hypothetical protein [Paenibacillus sp. yr247]SDO29951.1 hypothetical protein SAMN04487897_111112 [Paenibacillus sp. yr247]